MLAELVRGTESAEDPIRCDTGTRVIVPADVTYKGWFVPLPCQLVPVVQRFSTGAGSTMVQGSIPAVCIFFFFFLLF